MLQQSAPHSNVVQNVNSDDNNDDDVVVDVVVVVDCVNGAVLSTAN